MELDISRTIVERSKQQRKQIDEMKEALNHLLLSFTAEEDRITFIGGKRTVRLYPNYEYNQHPTKIEFVLLGPELVERVLEESDQDYAKMIELLYHKKQFNSFVHYLTHTIMPGVLNGSIDLNTEGNMYDFYIKKDVS